MLSFYQINSIALYETKTLLRSWFFRIFAFIAIVFLIFFNIQTLITGWGGSGIWSIKAIPSIIPYTNLLYLNAVQAVIAIFLASDFMKRDKKLDTTDVIYVRSMTNREYVFGKTLGNLLVFFILDIIILAITMVFNMITKNVEINFISYLYYFLIISIPTLIFIMGLSFLLMSLIKNQAVTFLILLIYIAVSLFYLGDKFYHLFDYMAYKMPLTFSDFIGFGNLKEILVLRGMYIFLGISFIFFTIVMMQRMPNSKYSRMSSALWGICFLVFGVFLGLEHINSFNQDKNMRAEMISHNEQYTGIGQLTVKNYKISLEHIGEKIRCESILKVKNEKDKVLDKIVFTLNPGLKVSKVLINGKDHDFSQVTDLIEIKGYSILSQQEAEFSFCYEGIINESSCYLDKSDSIMNSVHNNNMYYIDKRYAFITPKYLLLTREAGWYPVPGAGYGIKNKQWFNRQFSNFELDVKKEPELMAISQGQKKIKDDHIVFTSEHPLSEISLIVGDYEQKSDTIDSLVFSVYIKKGHDYFSDFFKDIKDTIPDLISESFHDYERKIDLDYPFNRFSIVEVPVQFYSYDRVFTGMKEQMQPEMVLFGEKGLFSYNADFYGSMQRINRRRSNGPKRTPEEEKMQLLRNFMYSITRDIFPLFYNDSYFIGSDKWPVADRIFESYKKSTISDNDERWMRDYNGMSNDERANMTLMSQNFNEILSDPNKTDVVENVMKIKGETLFSIIKYKVGDDAFDEFMHDFFHRYQFKATYMEDFIGEIKEKFDVNILEYMNEWFNSRELPAFLFGSVSAVKVIKDDEQMTMINFKATNTEKEQGVFTVDFRIGREIVKKTVFLEGKQTKDVTFLLEGTPRGITFNTLASKNIPNEIRVSLGKIPRDNKIIPYEEEKIVNDPVSMTGRNEIIVDNEDPGFSVTKGSGRTSLLHKILFSNKEKSYNKYTGFNPWWSPRNWRLTTNSGFYGGSILSAYYIRSGEGNKKAQWKFPVKDKGYYKIYVYIYKDDHHHSNNYSNKDEYHYTVYLDKDKEDIALKLKSADRGWNSLGSYYFSSDTVVVELSNKTKSKMVIADAVKLEKQE